MHLKLNKSSWLGLADRANCVLTCTLLKLAEEAGYNRLGMHWSLHIVLLQVLKPVSFYYMSFPLKPPLIMAEFLGTGLGVDQGVTFGLFSFR